MATEVAKRNPREASATAESLANVGNAVLADSDIYETEEALLIRMDLPGVEKGKVSIEVDDENVLQVRAKNAFEEPGKALAREFRAGDFYRSFRLGNIFDREKIGARLEHGVLEITIPKLEAVKPKKIEIKA